MISCSKVDDFDLRKLNDEIFLIKLNPFFFGGFITVGSIPAALFIPSVMGCGRF
jgi:hypothetical protein